MPSIKIGTPEYGFTLNLSDGPNSAGALTFDVDNFSGRKPWHTHVADISEEQANDVILAIFKAYPDLQQAWQGPIFAPALDAAGLVAYFAQCAQRWERHAERDRDPITVARDTGFQRAYEWAAQFISNAAGNVGPYIQPAKEVFVSTAEDLKLRAAARVIADRFRGWGRIPRQEVRDLLDAVEGLDK